MTVCAAYWSGPLKGTRNFDELAEVWLSSTIYDRR